MKDSAIKDADRLARGEFPGPGGYLSRNGVAICQDSEAVGKTGWMSDKTTVL